MGGVDGIVIEEKGVEEVEEPLGKAIELKDTEDPFVSNTREGSHEVPKGQDTQRERYCSCLGPCK